MANVSQALCSHEGYDPDWWSVDHPGRCPVGCPNRLAAHICSHCPLMYECQAEISSHPEQWVGVVMGGLISTRAGNRYNRRYEVSVVPASNQCTTCRPHLARVG